MSSCAPTSSCAWASGKATRATYPIGSASTRSTSDDRDRFASLEVDESARQVTGRIPRRTAAVPRHGHEAVGKLIFGLLCAGGQQVPELEVAVRPAAVDQVDLELKLGVSQR